MVYICHVYLNDSRATTEYKPVNIQMKHRSILMVHRKTAKLFSRSTFVVNTISREHNHLMDFVKSRNQ